MTDYGFERDRKPIGNPWRASQDFEQYLRQEYFEGRMSLEEFEEEIGRWLEMQQ